MRILGNQTSWPLEEVIPLNHIPSHYTGWLLGDSIISMYIYIYRHISVVVYHSHYNKGWHCILPHKPPPKQLYFFTTRSSLEAKLPTSHFSMRKSMAHFCSHAHWGPTSYPRWVKVAAKLQGFTIFTPWSSWWFQPLWNIFFLKMGIFPK